MDGCSVIELGDYRLVAKASFSPGAIEKSDEIS
jgi:hypothetical protein